MSRRTVYTCDICEKDCSDAIATVFAISHMTYNLDVCRSCLPQKELSKELILKMAKMCFQLWEFPTLTDKCEHLKTYMSEPHLAGARKCSDCGMYFNPNMGGWVDAKYAKGF